MGKGQQFSKNLFLSLSVAYWKVNNTGNCTFYIDFFSLRNPQNLFIFVALIMDSHCKESMHAEIYLVIFEQLFLAKLSLMPF